MDLLTVVLLFFLNLSSAAICNPDTIRLLRERSEELGIKSCLNVVNEYGYEDTPWCSCMKWPEVKNLIDENASDFNCQLTDDDHSDFTFTQAKTWCDVSTACTDVTERSVCESKNCLWSGTACTGVNTDRQNQDALVAAATVLMEVPWVEDCDMLVAVYKQYHQKGCNATVSEMESALKNSSALTNLDLSNYPFDTTLEDICGETCWFQEEIPDCPHPECNPAELGRESAPFVFFERHNCTTHADCNGDDANVNDYFCASCDACKAEYSGSDECGICALTNYNNTSVCIEMQQCTAEKSINGECASQTETGVTTGNRQCTASEVLANSQISSCFQYFGNLDDDTFIIDNACPCLLDNNFNAVDCAWDLEFLYTLEEMSNFCSQPCSQIMDRDSCLSAGTPEGAAHNCVWLNRLVKGQCVDNPCDNQENVNKCAHDTCLTCQSNAMGEPSCVVNTANIGMTCNDDDDETDRDVCTDTLYAKVPSSGGELKDFACKGINAEQKLEEIKVLCDDTVARNDCCINGEEYRCANGILNFTVFAGGNCNNASIATYQWQMDGTCSNVITTEARSRNIYFSGTCDVAGREANITSCDEHQYWAWLASETDNFVPFDDSASSLGVFFISVLLLFWFS